MNTRTARLIAILTLTSSAGMATAMAMATPAEEGGSERRMGVVPALLRAAPRATASRVIPREQLSAAMAALAKYNPRFLTGMHCFSDQLTEEQLANIMATYNALPPGLVFMQGLEINPAFRMDTTVWSGNGGQVAGSGTRATRASLTYSFPADGVLWGDPNAAQVANNLNSKLTTVFGAANLDQGREMFRQALTSWRRNAGLSYSEVADSNIAMDAITTRRPTVGDIRFGATPQGTASGVLAYDFFPSGGSDMTVNSDQFVANALSNSTNTYRYFRNVIAHEHGHGLGLFHQIPCDGTKLMEPFANTNFEMVALDDRRGAQRAYGDRFSGNTSAGLAKDFGDLTSPALHSVIQRDLSTNGQYSTSNPTGADWFKFTLGSAQPIDITVQPTGPASPYSTGNQTNGCSGTSANTNALGAGNLAVELRDATGASIILSANTNGNGLPETIAAGTLSAGTYTVRVFDAGPNAAADGIVQTYDLTIRVNTTVKASPEAYAGVNKLVAAGTKCFFYGSINSRANEGSLNGFAWDFNNDGTFETSGSALSRTYVTNGVFNATLRVTDTNGMTATDTITVTVTGATSTVTALAGNQTPVGSSVPITIFGTNFRGITSAANVTVTGTGVTVTGTPTVDYFGTVISGLTINVAANAPIGQRDLRVSTTDGLAVLTNGFTVQPICPVITMPADLTVNTGDPVTLAASVTGTGPLTYQWALAGNSFADAPPVSGSTTTTLSIASAAVANAGQYTLVVTGPCGTSTSVPVNLTVNPPAVACIADVNADGTVDGGDFVAFINSFAIADVGVDPAADVNHDGVIDGNDFVEFINAFALGC